MRCWPGVSRTSSSTPNTAGIDLAPALVEEDLGRDVALPVTRHLVMFLRRPGNQTQFSSQLAAQVAAREPLRELQRWIAEHPCADLSVPAKAPREIVTLVRDRALTGWALR